MFKKAVQKALSVSLAAVLALTPYSTALATTDPGTTGGGDSAPAVVEAPPVVTEAENVTNSTVPGAGRSTVNGVYAAKSVRGVAITTPAGNLAAALNLANGETAHIVTWDITQARSPLAYQSLVAAAQSVGGNIGPMLQFNLNKMSGGKLTPATGSANAAFGIPGNFQGYAHYALGRVIGGGAYAIYQDTDTNPNTITANIPAGNSALAIIGYN